MAKSYKTGLQIEDLLQSRGSGEKHGVFCNGFYIELIMLEIRYFGALHL